MGKRQDFIDLYKSGKGTRQKYIDLSGHGFRRKSTAVPVDPLRQLMIYEMLMSGALPSELKHGGIASLAPRKNYARGGWSPGVGRDERGYQSSHPSYQGGGGGGGGATIETPVIDRSNFNVEPIQTYKDKENRYLDQVGLGIDRNKAYAAGLLNLEDLMEGSIEPDIYAGISGDNFNIAGQKTKDMTGLYGNTSIGPFNVQGSYQDFDGDINKNIRASTNIGNFGIGTNYNFEGNPTYGASYNTDNFSGGLTYDGEPKAMFNFSKVLEPRPKSVVTGKYYAKGGLAGILNL